jgi:hypothetical protein
MSDKNQYIQQEQDGTFSCKLCGKRGFTSEAAVCGHLGVCPARYSNVAPAHIIDKPPVTPGEHEARISALEQAVVSLAATQERILNMLGQITQIYQSQQPLPDTKTVLGTKPASVVKRIIYTIAKTIVKEVEKEREKRKNKKIARKA